VAAAVGDAAAGAEDATADVVAENLTHPTTGPAGPVVLFLVAGGWSMDFRVRPVSAAVFVSVSVDMVAGYSMLDARPGSRQLTLSLTLLLLDAADCCR